MGALFAAKNYIEENLCKELNLMMVQVPLIVDWTAASTTTSTATARALRSSSTSPTTTTDPIDAEVVQAATKWKRWRWRSSTWSTAKGSCTDMRAVRKDYFLDHDHSAYVDQWDWELAGLLNKNAIWSFLTDVVQAHMARLEEEADGCITVICSRNWKGRVPFFLAGRACSSTR